MKFPTSWVAVGFILSGCISQSSFAGDLDYEVNVARQGMDVTVHLVAQNKASATTCFTTPIVSLNFKDYPSKNYWIEGPFVALNPTSTESGEVVPVYVIPPGANFSIVAKFKFEMPDFGGAVISGYTPNDNAQHEREYLKRVSAGFYTVTSTYLSVSCEEFHQSSLAESYYIVNVSNESFHYVAERRDEVGAWAAKF